MSPTPDGLRHSPLRTLIALALAAWLLPSLAPPVEAQQRSLEVLSFHSNISVQPNGDLLVDEIIQFRFEGSWNGVYRTIPVEYEGDYGANYTLRLDMREIRDDSGQELRWESERRGSNRLFRIYVPDAEDTDRTIVVRYRVANGLRFFEEHDELYWNVTGDESEVPIRSASAYVELPEGVTGLRSTAYAGPYGSRGGDVRIAEGTEAVEFATAEPLRFREGLTVVVGWDPGVVERPTATDRFLGFLLSNILLLVPFGAGIGMYAAWRRHGKDPEVRPVMTEYEPPEGLSPAEAGTLYDLSPDMRDITATIVDLAVRGFLTIEEVDSKGLFGLGGKEYYRFEIAAPRERWAELKYHERELMDAFFSDRDQVSTRELENWFYRRLPDIKDDLRRALVDEGHYLRDPQKVRIGFAVLGLALAVVVAVGGSVLMSALLGQLPVMAIVAGILTGLVVAVFGWFMPARTEHGTRVFERLKGFEEFIERVESDRYERVVKTPEMFERFLPFAMAFGVEANWAQAFDDIYQTPPDWYRGSGMPGHFRPHVLTHGLGRMSSTAGAAMVSAPRAKASSSGFGGSGFGGGFGGGGFSGGGFGGGGVGGF